jgi:hypothetical protein
MSLIIAPSSFGPMPLSNQYITYQSGLDYMLDPVSFQQVQNGIDTGLRNQKDPTLRYLYNGRALCAWTHVDILFQAYFVAYLVMNTLGVPLNPGNPYTTSRTQNGFDTLGQPDISATIGEVAARVLDTVWYQVVRSPASAAESSGGIAYTKTNQLGSLGPPQATTSSIRRPSKPATTPTTAGSSRSLPGSSTPAYPPATASSPEPASPSSNFSMMETSSSPTRLCQHPMVFRSTPTPAPMQAISPSTES